MLKYNIFFIYIKLNRACSAFSEETILREKTLVHCYKSVKLKKGGWVEYNFDSLQH